MSCVLRHPVAHASVTRKALARRGIPPLITLITQPSGTAEYRLYSRRVAEDNRSRSVEFAVFVPQSRVRHSQMIFPA